MRAFLCDMQRTTFYGNMALLVLLDGSLSLADALRYLWRYYRCASLGVTFWCFQDLATFSGFTDLMAMIPLEIDTHCLEVTHLTLAPEIQTINDDIPLEEPFHPHTGVKVIRATRDMRIWLT